MKDILLKAALLLILFATGDYLVFTTLKRGMDNYYGMDKEAKVLCVGHSHTVLGIDAERLEEELHVPVAKYATSGANTLDRYWMIRQFVEEHPTVRYVTYDVDPRLFDSEGLSSASYTLFLPYIENEAINSYIKTETTWQEYFSSTVVRTSRFRDQTINIALRGLLHKAENKKSTQVRIEDYAHYIEHERQRKIRINPESVDRFKKTVAYLTEKGIAVYLVFLPVTDLLNSADPENQEKVVQIFRDMAAENVRVRFLDYNESFAHRYDLFYDLRHLNGAGNEIMTGLLAAQLKSDIDE